jgi:hypothetical protein
MNNPRNNLCHEQPQEQTQPEEDAPDTTQQNPCHEQPQELSQTEEGAPNTTQQNLSHEQPQEQTQPEEDAPDTTQQNLCHEQPQEQTQPEEDAPDTTQQNLCHEQPQEQTQPEEDAPDTTQQNLCHEQPQQATQQQVDDDSSTTSESLPYDNEFTTNVEKNCFLYYNIMVTDAPNFIPHLQSCNVLDYHTKVHGSEIVGIQVSYGNLLKQMNTVRNEGDVIVAVDDSSVKGKTCEEVKQFMLHIAAKRAVQKFFRVRVLDIKGLNEFIINKVSI